MDGRDKVGDGVRLVFCTAGLGLRLLDGPPPEKLGVGSGSPMRRRRLREGVLKGDNPVVARTSKVGKKEVGGAVPGR
jgi:hypothetical protein